jgi:hypothetical protein
MAIPQKLKTDGPPIVFFALVVGAKTYSLWVYLTSNPALWHMLRNIGDIQNFGRGAELYLTTRLSYLLYFLTALAFDALTFYSFIVRGAAKSRPHGFWENIFPLITVFVPVIGFTLLFVPAVRQLLPGYSQAHSVFGPSVISNTRSGCGPPYATWSQPAPIAGSAIRSTSERSSTSSGSPSFPGPPLASTCSVSP